MRLDSGKAPPIKANLDYPYLTWAEAHSVSQAVGPISDRDYPLTWEAKASQAVYEEMSRIDVQFTRIKLCVPHTWHAAEMFLAIQDKQASSPRATSKP